MIYPRRPKKKVRPQDNLALIKQLNTVFPIVYTDAGDPTVNDDVDLGYKRGDIWINTTDDGTFVCRNNADGAADWIEIT